MVSTQEVMAGHVLQTLRKGKEHCLSFESLHEATRWVMIAVTFRLRGLLVMLMWAHHEHWTYTKF